MVTKTGKRETIVTSATGTGQKLFYGWIVVGASFVGTFFTFGIAYSFGPFFPVIESTFQASRSDVALVPAIAGGYCSAWAQ